MRLGPESRVTVRREGAKLTFEEVTGDVQLELEAEPGAARRLSARDSVTL